ncbi:MAG TPA: MBL fold metallo-hydrolase [Ktedonobacteraceae bacterium]|jgi:glyoxylase-like metal-dependent hydrolase (beta-lactamase superfamily II)|nr:MBL fold metallo-hydrolase [Ktedonobacteraceae bacterium]
MSQSVPELTCHMLDTGYCVVWEQHMIQGGRRQRVHCHALVALLQHPEHGWLLWDTGYAPHMLSATQHLPYSLYRRATPLVLNPKLAVAAQLARWNIGPHDIRRVIISHFHADHIAGLRDFPEAELIALESAYADVAARKGINALRRGFIPTLLPDDFRERATLLPPFTGSVLSTLGATYDLFNDGSLLFVELPGHAHGQIGMLVNTTRGRILFAADGCWLTRSVYERRPPSRMTHFFIDDARAMHATINHLADFALAYPDVTIVPSHCPEAFAREMGQEA